MGQNIYYNYGFDTTPSINLTKAVEEWWAEIAFYNYYTKECSDVCTHYTQVTS